MRKLGQGLRHIPVPPLDLDGIVRRGERLRVRRRAMFAGFSVATAVAVIVAASSAAILSRPDPDILIGPARVGGPVGMDVYLEDWITSEQLREVRSAARSLEGVVALRYVSKRAAYREFKDIYRTQPKFWENLPPNALPARFVVTLEDQSYLSPARSRLQSLDGVDEVRRAEKRSSSDASSCPESRGGSGWTSPETLVASGAEDGNAWVLCARTTRNPEAADEEGLCMNWAFGQSTGSGLNCVFRYDRDRLVSLDENYFEAIGGSGGGYFFGAVPEEAASVEFVSDDGASSAGTVYPSPPTLGVPFRFFTVFAEPYAEGTLRVRDRNGDVIREQAMEHGLSILTVEVVGEGEGRVVGYRTEELRFYEECQDTDQDCREPRPRWIDCGNECSVGLADATITLVSEAAEGSVFVGWSGACEEMETCALTVDEATKVTARFEPSP